MISIRTTGLRVLLTVVLVAAGIAGVIGSGGGGGGGFSSSVPYVAITTEDAFDVASAVVQAVGATFDLADATGGGVSPSASGAVPGAGILAARGVFSQLSRARIRGLTVQPATAFGPETVPCYVSGTVTLSGDLANPPSLTAGDRINGTFNDCLDEEPFIMDGGLTLVVREVEGDPLTDVYLLTLDITLMDLRIADDTGTSTADGDVTLTLDSLDFPVTLTQIAGGSLELASAADVYTLTGFDHSLQVDATVIPNTRLAQAIGTLVSDLLGGKVDYETVTPVQASGDDDPDTGEILITGAESTTIHVVIVDSANVRLDIDVDGNGSVDDSQNTSWAALNGDPSVIHSSTINASTAPVFVSEALAAVNEFGGAAFAVGGQFSVSYGGPFKQLAQQAVSGNFGPVPLGCPTSGTATVSGSIANAGTYSPGDQLNATYDSCSAGEMPFIDVMTGQMDVTVGTFTGSAVGPYVFSGPATLTNIRRVLPDLNPYTITTNLSTTFDATNLSGFPGSVTVTSSANSAVIQSGAITHTLSNATAEATVLFSSPLRITYAPSGNLVTSLLSGSVAFQSIQPFITDTDSDKLTGPFSGEMLITASDDSSVRLVTINEFTVRLDIDLDGDDVVDESIDKTWEALLCAHNTSSICRRVAP